MFLKKLFVLVIVLVVAFAAVSSEASILSEIQKLGKKGKELYENNKDKIDEVVKKGQALYKAYQGEDDDEEDNSTQQTQTQPVRRSRNVRQNQNNQDTMQTLQSSQENYNNYGNDRLIKSSTTDYPVGELENNLKVFAKNILVNNKATFEIQLAQNELPRNAGGARFNKVCAKGQTITAGDSGTNKNYRPFCFMTADPYFTFAGGIRVGAPIRTVENFFVTRVYDMADNPGHLHFESNTRTYIDILYDENSGRITQIGFYDTRGLNSNRTRSYMRQQARSFGFGTMY